ncbi:hypothetical protein DV738_g5209, partial [Chaetothyriales sp. CBS 135597]
MPIPLLAEGFGRGLSGIPYAWPVIKTAPWIALVWLLKWYFAGATCRAERVMHGKVVLVTGGTAGIGAAVVRELATRGAQIVLLTRHAPNDPFLVDYIQDLRTQTNNELIYAEQVDLASLHSIRVFATKWVDNAPPRRLDMIVLCASVMTPYWGTPRTTEEEGLEEEWMVNYLANFHLLSILSPAIRAQPPDRDVRVLFSTCSSYIGAQLDLNNTDQKTKSGSVSYARSKLALMTFAYAFQKHLDAYKRPDKMDNNARALIIDPGYSRTPGTQRWLSGGSLVGLFFYLFTWPIWWLLLKSADQGAQSYLLAAMDAAYAQGAGGKLIKECRELEPLRTEVQNEDIAKTLWQFSDKQIEQLEKDAAIKRAQAKKKQEQEAAKKETQEEAAAKAKPNAKAAASPSPNTDSAAAASSSATEQRKQTPGSRRSKKAK